MEALRPSPFDFLNSITHTKRNLFHGDTALEESSHDSMSKAYVPFVVNRSLSYHQDCIFASNEMNRYHSLAPKMQFDFLLGSVRKRKRFSKWAKVSSVHPKRAIELFVERYGYSKKRAEEAISVLTKEEVSLFVSDMERGRK